MNTFLQKLRNIFRRKPPEPFICGTMLMRMTPEQRERYLAASGDRKEINIDVSDMTDSVSRHQNK